MGTLVQYTLIIRSVIKMRCPDFRGCDVHIHRVLGTAKCVWFIKSVTPYHDLPLASLFMYL